MYKLANGWTKETIMAQVKKYNNGKPAVDYGGACLYKADNGNRCAIGCFIPDNHPGLEMEGSVRQLLETYPELTKLMPFIDSNALNVFQGIHDAQRHENAPNVYNAIKFFLLTHVQE